MTTMSREQLVLLETELAKLRKATEGPWEDWLRARKAIDQDYAVAKARALAYYRSQLARLNDSWERKFMAASAKFQKALEPLKEQFEAVSWDIVDQFPPYKGKQGPREYLQAVSAAEEALAAAMEEEGPDSVPGVAS